MLEDNARTPSGVSYMLENREIMMRLFPELFARHRVAPVENYPDELLATLRSVAPRPRPADPTVVLLTPGVYNSAYYEHSFLADKLGVELVEGRDLFVKDEHRLHAHDPGAEARRRDLPPHRRRLPRSARLPAGFRARRAGLMSAYQAGNVTLANAVGTGIADDKAVYSYMPEIVKFYLGEEPILKNVPTWRCREPEHLAYVLDHLDELVVKEVHGSGGYGMLIGPKADKAQIAAFRAKLKPDPKNFIAQPTLALSTCPTCVEAGVAPRHVDLRPFVLTGRDRIRIVPGGLTRVALKKGSLVVNSSQGGGTKDTWVLDDDGARPMLSRTADNLYWLARYVERAEYLARILEATQRLTALPLAYVGATNEWESAVATAGCADAFFAAYDEANEETVTDFLCLLDRQPVLDPQLLRDRAHQRARGAHRAHHGDVGRDQRRLARAQALRQPADLARGVHALPALGAGILAALRRLGLPHHAAQRRLLVLAARRLHRARRQHRAHPRREISPAAAGRRAGRRPARLFPVGGDPALGLGADRLSLGLSRERQALADRRPADPQRARCRARSRAATSNLVQNLDHIAGAYGRQGPAQRQARSIRARLENSRMEEIFQTGLHEFIGEFIADNNRLGAAITEQYLA